MGKTRRAWTARSMMALGLLSAGPPASAQTTTDGMLTSRFRDRGAAAIVRRAVEGARRRLDRPACRRLFSEFTDESGRPLADVLEAKGTSGPDYLGRIIFYDGEPHRQCRRETILAFTAPGSAVVLLCAEFMKAGRRDPKLAEAVLIHEALHTLGLGENPPTSAQITARVLNRCPD
jgi:hypothetical protein